MKKHKKLIVGDITELLTVYATGLDPLAAVVTQQNYTDFVNSTHGTFYTSLGDFENLEQFDLLLMQADQVEFYDSTAWSSGELKQQTLYRLGLYHWATNKSVINLDFDHVDINVNLGIHPRQGVVPNLWTFGCSITYGCGVDQQQVFGNLLQKKLSMPWNNLATPASSMGWSADQILRSDIKAGDTVVWGLTSLRRYSCYFYNQMYHITYTGYQQNKFLQQILPKDWIGGHHVVYDSLQNIAAVNNFCNKIGAKLLMLGVMTDYQNLDDLKKYPNFVMGVNKKYIDLGSDGAHPGPEHHQHFADLVIKKLS